MSAGRILFASEKFPWPVDDGGQARTYNVLACLAREFPVTLLALAPPDPSSVAPIEALGVEVELVGRRAPRWQTPAWAALSTFTRAPHPMGKNRSSAMLRALKRRIEAGGVLGVHFNHLDTAQYVERLGSLRSRVRCVFDTHNVLTTMYERFHETARNPLAKGFLHLQWMKMNGFERAIMKQMDLVCVCSDLERALLRTWGVEKALVVPNGVDTDYFTPPADPVAERAEPPLVVFTGAMGYAPNADGVRWFLDEVLPKLCERVPGVRFRVVGKDPPADLLARARDGSIEFTGYVDDVRPHMRGASVFVCPLRIGGGTRLKILDALSLGLPVVSTTVGAEGLAVTHGHDVELADDAVPFADAIAALVRDERRAREFARHGRELVLARYGWTGVTRPLVERLRAEDAPLRSG
ncbi:MAG: glycosyltransferase [Planctomycetes bacterium]|nr:glycosyltransferase [Planctomycetota bacterium]